MPCSIPYLPLYHDVRYLGRTEPEWPLTFPTMGSIAVQ